MKNEKLHIYMKLLKYIIRFFYWNSYNYRNKSKIYYYNLSMRSSVGKYVKIRKNNYIYGKIEIGDYSYISGPDSIIHSCKIGKFSSIARGVIIGPNNHDLLSVSTHPFLYSNEYHMVKNNANVDKKPIPIIGNDVWIGINSIIMKGVKIGDGAIIAAGSVVTKDIEPFSIVGGVPAKHIKYRFSERKCDSLIKSKWWNWSEDKIKDNIKYFRNIDLFVKDIK